MRSPEHYIIGWTGDQVTYYLSADKYTKVTVRPSGNEPVLKYYVQHWSNVSSGDLDSVRTSVDTLAESLEKDIMDYTGILTHSVQVR